MAFYHMMLSYIIYFIVSVLVSECLLCTRISGFLHFINFQEVSILKILLILTSSSLNST